MTKIFWKSLLVTPAVLGAALIASSGAMAVEAQDAVESSVEFAPVELSEVSAVEEIVEAEASVDVAQAAPVDSSSLNQVVQYANESDVNSMGQVTSIDQLSDVRPTDWAYQALQSLVERYGCIAGYPDGTYRGQQAMTRFEFAAGLNACLDRINEIIAAGLADVVTREELAAIQRLQEEFAAELATLRGRVDALEARTDELEANQFSTTTKLSGSAIFNIAAEFGDVADDQATFGYRVRQNFDSSFTGEDRLRVRLQARDIENFAGDPEGFSYGDDGDSNGDVVLDDLFYDFPLTDSIDVRVGANSLTTDDLVASTISPLDSSESGSLSNFGFPQQYDVLTTGDAGAGIIFQFSDALSLDLGYTAGTAADPAPGFGLFNGSYSAISQLTYLGSNWQAAATYIHSYLSEDDIAAGTAQGVVGNTLGFQTNFIFGNFEVGGGLSYTNAIELATGDADVWSWQGTLVLNDLGGEGNKLMLLGGVLPYTRDGGLFAFDDDAAFEVDAGGDTSALVELSYLFQVNDRISITPGIIWIEDAIDSGDDAFIGALRTTFEF